MTAFLSSCGVRGPEAVVDDFCLAMKTLNLDEMGKCTSCEIECPGVLESKTNMSKDAEEVLHEYMCINAAEIQYTLGKLTRNNSNAWIDVEFNYADSSKVIEGSIEDLLKDAIKSNNYGKSKDKENISKEFPKYFDAHKKDVKNLPLSSVSVRFSLTEDKNGWHINYVPPEIYDIMSGNLMSTLEEFEKFYEEDLSKEQQ